MSHSVINLRLCDVMWCDAILYCLMITCIDQWLYYNVEHHKSWQSFGISIISSKHLPSCCHIMSWEPRGWWEAYYKQLALCAWFLLQVDPWPHTVANTSSIASAIVASSHLWISAQVLPATVVHSHGLHSFFENWHLKPFTFSQWTVSHPVMWSAE